MLKKALIFLLSVCSGIPAAAYTDHRGHNVDSLETVMAAWTARDLAQAGEDELKNVAEDLYSLMWGFNNTNRTKSEYYARMLAGISRRMGWDYYEVQAMKNIGQHFWAKEQYDSAAVCYSAAVSISERMPVTEDGADHVRTYSPDDKDDAMSQLYGSLGNLYSMMDSITLAMEYYGKAGEIFKKHSWNESCADLYYNMGETMRYEEEFSKAEEYYKESLRYSYITGDSLEVATACKGLGSLFMDTGRASKALRYLTEANRYFADHEKEELQFRMEALDYTGQVLALQKKRMGTILLLFAITILLAAATFTVSRKLKRTTREKNELSEVLEDTVDAIVKVPSPEKGPTLKPREKEVLDLIAKGYTNSQIAEAMSLSPETIKWYKKKFFAMFDASNSAELVKIAKDRGLL